MKLSDAYVHAEDSPQLELIVTQININPGYNDELFHRCPVLGDYMAYVDKVRTYQKRMSLADAVNKAVDECINEGILADFLKKNKAVVKSMSIYEYDEKLHEKTMMEIGREEGLQQGIRGTITTLRSISWTDDAIIEKLIDVYGIDIEEAKAFLSNN